MRLLFVNQYFPPDVAATAYLLGELAEDLAKHHDVTVVAGTPSYNPEAGQFRPEGVRVVRARSTRFPRGTFAGRGANYATFGASALVRTMTLPRPDVVVGLTDPPVIGLVAMLAARRHGVPFVYVCHDIFPDVAVALGRMENRLAVESWRRLNRRIRAGAAAIVAIGRDMVEKLQNEGVPPERIALIPNWAPAQTGSEERAQRIRDEHAWNDAFVVMHAGNLGLAQDLQTVLEAAERLRGRSDIQFALVGDGAARRGLERHAAAAGLDNVTFLPYVPKEDVHDMIRAADAHLVTLAPGLKGCVVPSKVYGIMAAGRPLVAAVDDGSEIDLLIEEHGCGIRVPTRDAQALAATISQLREWPLDDIGRRGRRAFERLYHRGIATERYRHLLEKVGRDGRAGSNGEIHLSR